MRNTKCGGENTMLISKIKLFPLKRETSSWGNHYLELCYFAFKDFCVFYLHKFRVLILKSRCFREIIKQYPNDPALLSLQSPGLLYSSL